MKQSLWSNPLLLCNLGALCLWLSWVCLFNLQLDLTFGDCVRSFRFHELNVDYLHQRYSTWTSRLLIESLLLPLARHPELFRWLNMVVMGVMPLLVWQLFPARSPVRRHLWLVIFLVSLYQINNMSTAGWRATFVNYWYPLAAGLVALRLRGETRWQWQLALAPVLLFACNQEQVCFLLTAIFAAHLLLNRADFRPIQLTPLLLCLASLLFTLTTPGNTARMYSSALLFEPGYYELSFLYKAYVGFQEAAIHWFYNFQPLYLAFAITLFFAWKRMSSTRGQRLLLPATIIYLQPLWLLLFGPSDRYRLLAPGHLTSFGLWLQFLLAMALSLGLVWMLYCSFKEERRAWLAVALFALGFTSKCMLGLSPSLFGSTLRTAIFGDFTFIYLSLMLIEEHGFLNLLYGRLRSAAATALALTAAAHLLSPTLQQLH